MFYLLSFIETMGLGLIGIVAILIAGAAYLITTLIYNIVRVRRGYVPPEDSDGTREMLNLPSIVIGLLIGICSFYYMKTFITTSEDIANEEAYAKTVPGLRKGIDKHLNDYRDCILKSQSYQNSGKRNSERVRCSDVYGYKNAGYWRGVIERADVSDSEQEELMNYFGVQWESKVGSID